MIKRVLTRDEELAIRACHQDFGGMSVVSAATVLGITPHRVASLLRSAEKRAPTLFPILTHRQALVLEWWESNKTEPPESVRKLDGGIKDDIAFLRKHRFITSKPETVQFNPALHEGRIKEVF